ncbi:MAG: S8 family serine peptidase, partial [Solirubrobacteraceae bacterium]|nr:S8 family serine peptidase [Solirubrobacteraceae bacterium]
MKDASQGATRGMEYTGKTLVLFSRDATPKATDMLQKTAGISALAAPEVGEKPVAIEEMSADGVMYQEVGVAVVDADPDQIKALEKAAAGPEPVLAVEAERVVYAIETTQHPEAEAAEAAPTAAPWRDTDDATWGLHAVGAMRTHATGAGIAVAILDTGIDERHPDFATRDPQMRSFVAGQEARDGNGHGTHCAGTSCGSLTVFEGPRYGVAPDANLFCGKVLSNEGSGGDQGILAGIDWAISNGCDVVSMSLGAGLPFGTAHSDVYETVARRALDRGTLIVAAAGNESNRPGEVAPVGHPANCPSIMAVAAINGDEAIAPFSCTSDPLSGQVD